MIRANRPTSFVPRPPSCDQAAEHRIGCIVAMQSKAGNIGLVARTRHCPMHGLDDVSPNPEIAQRILGYPA